MNSATFQIQFQPLTPDERVLSFPCDPQGHVDMDALSPTMVENYLFARAMVGRDYARPAMVQLH